MVTGTLYTYPENFRAYKALIAAEYSGAKVKVASEAPEFVLGETNKSAEFLAKFPLGKVPAFASADGKNIFESNAIAYYLANEQLRGQSIDAVQMGPRSRIPRRLQQRHPLVPHHGQPAPSQEGHRRFRPLYQDGHFRR